MNPLWQDLVRNARALFDIELSPEALAKLSTFVRLIEDWSRKINLVSARSTEEIVHRHVLDSLAPAPFLAEGKTIADLGSGAGFPGIPLALARPSCAVLLVESRLRRASFLRHACRVLPLENSQVIGERAEVYAARHPDAVDAVTVRAVRLDALADSARMLLMPCGLLLVMRKVAGSIRALEGFTPQTSRRYELPGGYQHEVVVFTRDPS